MKSQLYLSAFAFVVKKAYKKKALETHPDRLPAGSTPADKKVSEERFQKVSTAYEVLLDQTKRRVSVSCDNNSVYFLTTSNFVGV